MRLGPPALAQEPLEFFSFNTPAGLTTNQRSLELPGLQPAAHGFGVQVKLGRYLVERQESFGGHRRHNHTSVAPSAKESCRRIDKSMEE